MLEYKGIKEVTNYYFAIMESKRSPMNQLKKNYQIIIEK